MAGEPHEIWDVAAELGEGPVWVERERALWFTDIKKQKVHRFDPASGERRSWDSPEQVGFVLPANDGAFVAGLQSGLYRFEPADGQFEMLIAVEPDKPANRLNDGVVAPDGTLWFGTMDNGERAKTGSFYRYRDGQLAHAGVTDMAITNGPAISPDGRLLYWVDTLGGGIFACPLEEDGTLGESRPFVQIRRDEGYPDGPTIDAEGCVWVSLYAGWQARRYSPAGELIETVQFPVANVTKIAFGGDGLRTAFATTARQLLSGEEIARQPQVGNLFAFDAGVRGVPCPHVIL